MKEFDFENSTTLIQILSFPWFLTLFQEFPWYLLKQTEIDWTTIYFLEWISMKVIIKTTMYQWTFKSKKKKKIPKSDNGQKEAENIDIWLNS